jgi:hypothetical protein
MVRERAGFKNRSALNDEYPNCPFNRHRFAEAKSDSQLLCQPQGEKAGLQAQHHQTIRRRLYWQKMI